MASFTVGTNQGAAQLIFNATTWASIAQNASSSPATVLYMSLHNADPGDNGTQSTNETIYTNYARVAVARTTSGWTVLTGGPPVLVQNAGAVTFPQCGTQGDTLTHFGIGLASTGAGTLLASGPIGSGPALEFTCTNASPGVLTVPGSSLAVNARVSCYPTATGTLPTGITEGVVYYVGIVTGIAITLSTTAGNANPVNTTSVGAGNAIAQTPLAVSNLITPSFAANSATARLWALLAATLFGGVLSLLHTTLGSLFC